MLIQGDSLNNLFVVALNLQNAIKADGSKHQLLLDATNLTQRLESILVEYEDALIKNDISLPYDPPVRARKLL